MPKPDYAGDTAKYGKFDSKVKSSAGTGGRKKVKILLDAAAIYPKV